MHWLDLGEKKNTYTTDTSRRRGLAWVPWHVMMAPSGRASIAFCAHWENFMDSDRMSWLVKLSFSETSLLILSPEILTTAELIYNSKVLGQEKTWVLIWFPFLSGTPNGSHNLPILLFHICKTRDHLFCFALIKYCEDQMRSYMWKCLQS